MKKPIIGVTTGILDNGKMSASNEYCFSLWEAGAVPAFLPPTRDVDQLQEYAESLDGLLFSGGGDVNPAKYGETVAFDNVDICQERDDFEFALADCFLKTGKPIFGICRGIQVMNVAMGGSLYQHIDGHRQTTPGNSHEQPTSIVKGTKIEKIIGENDILVNTFHHQSVKTLGRGLIASAYSSDGVIEAIESVAYPFYIGVQFHPELFRREDRAARVLFEAFVGACK